MNLIHLLKVGEDEIICDLAETYKILNYRELSPSLVATLVLGLRDDSRIKKKISDTKISLDEMLLALMVDNLQFISWTKTKSAQKGHGKPESLFKKLMGLDEKKPKDDLMTFATVEEYKAYIENKRGIKDG